MLVLLFALLLYLFPQEYLDCHIFCFDLMNDYILDHIGIRKHDDRIYVKGVLHPKYQIFWRKLKFFSTVTLNDLQNFFDDLDLDFEPRTV